jgi:hypothetical protein
MALGFEGARGIEHLVQRLRGTGTRNDQGVLDGPYPWAKGAFAIRWQVHSPKGTSAALDSRLMFENFPYYLVAPPNTTTISPFASCWAKNSANSPTVPRW